MRHTLQRVGRRQVGRVSFCSPMCSVAPKLDFPQVVFPQAMLPQAPDPFGSHWILRTRKLHDVNADEPERHGLPKCRNQESTFRQRLTTG